MQSGRTIEFGSTYRSIAYNALDSLKNPTSSMLNPRANDANSASFDECVAAAINLVNGNISNLNISINDYKFFVDDSAIGNFSSQKCYLEDGTAQWIYYYDGQMLEAKHISLDRLNFFDYYGY